MQCRRGGVAGVGEASRRWQRPSLDRLGLGCRWGEWRRGQPHTASPGPQLSFIVMCDGGHQPCRVGRPRSGRENKAQRPFDLLVWRSY
jgi:hypothetical protein